MYLVLTDKMEYLRLGMHSDATADRFETQKRLLQNVEVRTADLIHSLLDGQDTIVLASLKNNEKVSSFVINSTVSNLQSDTNELFQLLEGVNQYTPSLLKPTAAAFYSKISSRQELDAHTISIITFHENLISSTSILKSFKYLEDQLTAEIQYINEKREQEYIDLVREVPDFACQCDFEGKILSIDKKDYNGLGYKIDELQDVSFFTLFHPDDRGMIQQHLDSLRGGKVVENLNGRLKSKHGGYLTYSLWAKTIAYSNSFLVIGRNINQLRKKEQELQLHKRRLEESQKIARIGTWEINFVEETTYWSETVYDITGYDNKTFKPHPNTIQEIVYEEDRQLLKKEVEQSRITGEFNCVCRIKCADGSLKYIRAIAKATYSNSGDIIGYNGTIQDISELKESEIMLRDEKRRFLHIIEGTDSGTWEWNVQTGEVILNERWADIIGYTLEELKPLSIDTWLKVVHPEDLKVSDRLFEKHFNKEIDRYQCEVRLKHKNGHWVWILDTGKVGTWTADGKPEWVFGTHQVIDDRKKAEQELKNTQNILAVTNQITKTGGWSYDVKNDLVRWTDNTKNLYEVDLDFEPTLQTVFDFLEESADKERVRNFIRNAIENNKTYDLITKVRTYKGRKFWARIIGVPGLHDGKVAYLHGTIQDVDTLKRNEIALEEKTTQFNEMVDSIIVGVYRLNKEGVLDFVSKRFLEIFEITDPKEQYTDMELVEKYLHPDDRENFIAANTHALENNVPFSFNCRIITEQGKHKWIHIGSRPGLDVNDNLYWFGAVSDITAEKIAQQQLESNEAKLQTIISSLHEGLLFYDEKGVITEINESATAILEIEREQILNKKLTTTPVKLYNKDKEPIEPQNHPVQIILDTGTEFTEIRIGIENTINGVFKWLEVNCKPLFVNQERSVLVTFKDITAGINADKKLLEAKRAAEEANKAKSNFLANMSHEIRTPLNGVVGFSDLLARTPLNNEQSQYIHNVHQSANSLLDIINDILDFSKIEAGKLTINPGELDLLRLGEQVMETISFQANQKNLQLLLSIDFKLPQLVIGDEVRLRQVLINLLGNAIKFTDEGEIELSIRQAYRRDGKIGLQFAVNDTGIGIKEKDQEQIFDAFTQADLSVNKRHKGTGLGLAISNKLLELMGSQLTLISSYGQGSSFGFELDLDYTASETIETKLSETSLTIKNILLDVQNPKRNESLKQILNKLQINTDDYSPGTTFKDNKPRSYDVVVVDEKEGQQNEEKLKTVLGKVEAPVLYITKNLTSHFRSSSLENHDRIHKILKPTLISNFIKSLRSIESGDLRVQNPGKTYHFKAGKLTILIAEDNEINAYLAETIVKSFLPETIILKARNGEEAVKLYEKESADLILMDIQMPKINGLDASKRIRKFEKEKARKAVPIIALSAGTMKEEKDKALASGMDAFLDKPLVQKQLEEMLKDFLPLIESSQSSKDSENNSSDNPINETEVSSVIFDEDFLRKRLNNDESAFNHFVEIAIRNLQEFKRELKLAKRHQDPEKIHSIVHKMKGAAAAAGFQRLKNKSEDLLERDISNQRTIDLIEEALQNIEELESFLQKYAT